MCQQPHDSPMPLGRPYVEIGTQCPLFRHVQRICTSDSGYSLSCPIPYQFTCPTLCQTMFMVSPPHLLHRFVSESLIAVNRYLMGVRSCITVNHVEFWASEIDAVWGLNHRRFQLAWGYLRTIHISLLPSASLWMVRRIPYIWLRILCWGTFVLVGDM